MKAPERLELVMEPGPGPLLPQVRRALAAQLGPGGEALRWAITGQVPGDDRAPTRLTLEVVVLRLSP